MFWWVLDVRLSVANVIDGFDVVVSFLDGVDDDSGERKRNEHYDPAGKEFVQVWSLSGIHTKGASGTSGLDGLVDTCEAGDGERVVAECGHDPVDESLVTSITEKI